jgi:hypothetical protein
MANVDNPVGFYPVKQIGGETFPMHRFIVTTGQIVYRGDLLVMLDAGTVSAAAANDGVKCIGVAAEYVNDAASAGGKEVLVYFSPMTVFGIQCDTGTAVAQLGTIFHTANHVATTGDTVTKLSKHELDSSDLGTGSQMRVIGLVDKPGNAWGEHADVEVVLVEHALADATTIS